MFQVFLRNAISVADETQVFVNRQIAVEAEFLGYVTKLGTDAETIPPHIQSLNQASTRAWAHQSVQHPNCRGLPGAVGSQESEDLARTNRY